MFILLPIHQHQHPLDKSISSQHIKVIQHQYHLAHYNPDLPLSTADGHQILNVTLLSFHNLLTYGSPIDDSIIHSFLLLIHSAHNKICFLDTNFFRVLKQDGRQHAYCKFFLHESSSRYSHKTNLKPTIDSTNILIPIHIQITTGLL